MFLRSVSRAAARSSAMPTTATRSYRTVPSPIACLNARPQPQQKSIASQQTRASSEHAISNPTLAGIEKRWEAMPPQEQAELWMQLRDRMKVDWHQMTLQEKKAGMYLSLARIPDIPRWSEFLLTRDSSLLDCFRSSRPPCGSSQGRGHADLLEGHSADPGLLRRLLRDPSVRQAPA
jgi:hypothetical protein